MNEVDVYVDNHGDIDFFRKKLNLTQSEQGANVIYYHYLVGDKTKNPIRTMDIDLYVKKNIPVIDSRTLEQILTEAGLRSTFKSRDLPPVIHYEVKLTILM